MPGVPPNDLTLQLLEWELDEPLGDQATIAMILYANQNHPNLKTEYPIWADRVKQIAKIWTNFPIDKRQPYVQAARENRTASRMKCGAAGSWTMQSLQQLVTALEDPNYNPQQVMNILKANPNLMAALKHRNQQQLQQDGANNDIFSRNELLRLLKKIDKERQKESKQERRMLKNGGYAAICRVKRKNEEKKTKAIETASIDLEKRNEKLKSDLKSKRSAMEEAEKETEQLRRMHNNLTSECEQLKKEHELYLMKVEEDKATKTRTKTD